MCEWCKNPNAEDAKDPESLCRSHLAEFEGLTVDEIDRRDREQASEGRWHNVAGIRWFE